MTQQNYSHISYLLDRSGSMWSIWADATGGYESFIKDQKAVPGKATFSLSVFDNQYAPLHSFVDLQSLPDTFPAEIQPGGSTSLVDALGRMIDETGSKLAALPEDERPSKVIFVIYTDGQENSSRELTLEQVRERIKHQTDTYGWDFIFLASNIDVGATVQAYGFSGLTSTPVHMSNLRAANHMTASKVASYRSTGDKADLSYSVADSNTLAQAPNEP